MIQFGYRNRSNKEPNLTYRHVDLKQMEGRALGICRLGQAPTIKKIFNALHLGKEDIEVPRHWCGVV